MTGSLSSALQLVQKVIHDAAVTGASRLSGTGVSFERWCSVVAALDAGREPGLEAQEGDALVARGYIQRTYRLGGPA